MNQVVIEAEGLFAPPLNPASNNYIIRRHLRFAAILLIFANYD